MNGSRVGAVLAVAFLGLAAGCGGSGGGTTSGTASASASTTGEAAPSASAATPSTSPSTTTSASSSGGLTGSDLFPRLVAAQRKAGSYTFTLTTGLGGQSVTGKGEADTTTSPASTEVTVGVGGQQIQTISTGGLYYLKGALFGGGSKWLKIDPKSSTGAGAILGQLGSSDPTSALAALQQAASVKKGGSASVGGTSTTEYDVTVPGSALAKSSQLQSALPKTIDYQLFVDSQDLLRRLTSTLTVQGRQVATKIDFAGYGSKVSISAPPASEVTTTP